MGHSFLIPMATRKHASQKRCPQGVRTGDIMVSKQMGHRSVRRVSISALRVIVTWRLLVHMKLDLRGYVVYVDQTVIDWIVQKLWGGFGARQ